jgi:hypothetical protein
MCGCKRSLEEFSAPLSPLRYGQASEMSRTAESAKKNPLLKRTVRELTRAGWTTKQIAEAICPLPNIVLPAFRDENICHCKYEGMLRCMVPDLPTNTKDSTLWVGEEEAPKIASPYSKNNILVNAITRLSSRFICNEENLPFWAGIIECGLEYPDGYKRTFYAHPRKHLGKARAVDTMHQLINFANQSRIHFKSVNDEDLKTKSGYTIMLDVPCEDPNATTDFVTGQTYAYRNGKVIIERPERRFQHIFMNTNMIPGFDQSSDEWKDLTIASLKSIVFMTVNTLCHEFAHAMMMHYTMGAEPGGVEPCMNDEPVAEAGYAWENFTSGGMVTFQRDADKNYSMACITPWPDLTKLKVYQKNDLVMPLHRFVLLPVSREHSLHGSESDKFLEPSFWKQEKDPKAFKKMWLRPYYEAPADEDEYKFYSTGHESTVDVLAKKRRLSDAAMDRQRAYAQKVRRFERTSRPDRWHRCMEKLQERKEEFHDREKDLLDALWKRCVPIFDGKTFLK